MQEKYIKRKILEKARSKNCLMRVTVEKRVVKNEIFFSFDKFVKQIFHFIKIIRKYDNKVYNRKYM